MKTIQKSKLKGFASVILIAAALFPAVPALSAAKKNPLLREHSVWLPHDGGKRLFHVHLPPSYTGAKPTPVVVVLHGGGGTWKGARKGSQMDLTADARGFITVYPNSGPNKRWNVGERKQQKSASNLDDIGFFNAMLDNLEKRFNVDKRRIYFTGLSNGGFMSYRVACEMSGRVAAVAPVACAMPFTACAPSRKVPVLHIHGTGDTWIPYNGGVIRSLGDPVPPVEETVGFWRRNNQCAEPRVSLQNGDSTCVSSACADRADVALCTVEGGGHVWPGGGSEGDGPIFKRLVGRITQDLIAREAIWDFFEKHPLNESK